MEKEVAATRIKAIANALHIQVKELATETDINIQQMYAYSAGQSLPTWPNLDKILTRFPNISAEYLMRGKGAVLSE